MKRKRKRIISIFGSGHMEENFSEYQRAVQLGRILAENGYTILSGGYGGIMEAVSRGAKQVGGKTIGVITDEVNPNANRWIDKVQAEKSWRDRLFRLISMGDAFLVFDGGTGTLTELFTVWEMMNKRLLAKPLIVYGTYLVKFIKRLKKQPLVIFNERLLFASTPRRVLEYLEDEFEKAPAS